MKNTAGTKIRIHRHSFQLGMINCFVEMVACGVKTLALSPPLLPDDYRTIGPLSDEMVDKFGIQSYLEKSLMITDLQPPSFTAGKWSILYFRDPSVLQQYHRLKKRTEVPQSPESRKLVSREFMKLLSYPENIIEEKLNAETAKSPFMTIE